MDVFIKKIGATVTVDWDRLPAEMQENLKDYGLKQKLSDGLSEMSAAKGHTVEEMAFTVNEALAGLYAGEWGSRGRTGDPVAQRAKAIAQARVKTTYDKAKDTWHKAMRDKGYDPTAAESRAKFLATAVANLAKARDIIALAKEQLAAEGGEAIDLDSLMA